MKRLDDTGAVAKRPLNSPRIAGGGLVPNCGAERAVAKRNDGHFAKQTGAGTESLAEAVGYLDDCK